MHDQFIQYVNQHAVSPLNSKDTAMIKRAFQPMKLRKKAFFLRRGEVCRHYGFVISGAMRQYSIDEKGNEHVLRLSIENWWVGDRESFILLIPTDYYIDAWEETDLLIITRADLLALDTIPAFVEMKHKLDENHAFAAQKRVNETISLSAEQRFEALSRNYPEFLQRFPQHIIASYLGITKETLSRVRNHARTK
jgi:CRP-like cAMP-binding protein